MKYIDQLLRRLPHLRRQYRPHAWLYAHLDGGDAPGAVVCDALKLRIGSGLALAPECEFIASALVGNG